MWNNALTWLIEFFLQFNGWFRVVQVFFDFFVYFALQSLRLSNGNEQNLCNLAHCRVLWSVSSPPSRERQGGVNRVPQALQACILAITRGKSGEVDIIIVSYIRHGSEWRVSSSRLPGRTKARPDDHACPVAPRRDPTNTPTRSHQGATLRPRLLGRTEARPYDRSVLRNVGCLFLAHK